MRSTRRPARAPASADYADELADDRRDWQHGLLLDGTADMPLLQPWLEGAVSKRLINEGPRFDYDYHADWDKPATRPQPYRPKHIPAKGRSENELIVLLVHCKFSSELQPGARVGDLYEVCGQAQRSAHLRQNPSAMLRNLVRRERDRVSKGTTGLLHGSEADLLTLRDAASTLRPRFHIAVSQPGYSKAKGSIRTAQVLGGAATYVSEIAVAGFEVWCSA